MLPTDILLQRFEKSKNIEEKRVLFYLWLEAMVKLNVSIHVGWLLKEQSSATDNIKTKLVRFIQRPPSIGTSLDLSRSINKLMLNKENQHPVIQRFVRLFIWMDPLLSSMLESRNKSVHGGEQISELQLDHLANEMRSISGHEFYQSLKIESGTWLVYGEMSGVNDLALLSELDNSPWAPPFFLLEDTKAQGSVLSVFPITTFHGDNQIIFWNKKSGNRGVYSDYTSESREAKFDSILDLCGFPFESWKTRADPLFERYLNSRERALETLVIEKSASLQDVNQEIDFALRLEVEIGIPQDERINALQIANALTQKARQMPKDPMVDFYYRKVFQLNGDALQPPLYAKLLELKLDGVNRLLLKKKEKGEALTGLLGVSLHLLLQWAYKSHGSATYSQQTKAIKVVYSKLFQTVIKKQTFGRRIVSMFSAVRSGLLKLVDELEAHRDFQNIDLEIDMSEEQLVKLFIDQSKSIIDKGLLRDASINKAHDARSLTGIFHRIGVIVNGPRSIADQFEKGGAQSAVDWTLDRVYYLLGDPRKTGDANAIPDVPSAIFLLRILSSNLIERREFGLASMVSNLAAIFAHPQNRGEIFRVCRQLIGQEDSGHLTAGEIEFENQERVKLLVMHSDLELWAALNGYHTKEHLSEIKKILLNQAAGVSIREYWTNLFKDVHTEKEMSLYIQSLLEDARSQWYICFGLLDLAQTSLNLLVQLDGGWRERALVNLTSVHIKTRNFEAFKESIVLLEKILNPQELTRHFLAWIHEIGVNNYAELMTESSVTAACPCGSGKMLEKCHLAPRYIRSGTLLQKKPGVNWK